MIKTMMTIGQLFMLNQKTFSLIQVIAIKQPLSHQLTINNRRWLLKDTCYATERLFTFKACSTSFVFIMIENLQQKSLLNGGKPTFVKIGLLHMEHQALELHQMEVIEQKTIEKASALVPHENRRFVDEKSVVNDGRINESTKRIQWQSKVRFYPYTTY